MDCKSVFENVRAASREFMAGYSQEKVNGILLGTADAIGKNSGRILQENAKDLAAMDKDNPKFDRLRLTPERLEAIASDMRNVASLPSPVGQTIERRILPNGLELSKVRVPFGVIGIIYEARPNVTFDVFSLCLKSGNCCLLKGGSDAEHSNRAIIDIIHEVLKKEGMNTCVAELLPSTREATEELLHARDYVDLIIPRGSGALINSVRENATIPVIETGAGVCHIYFDEEGDLEIGTNAVNNSKTRRVSVCNALDCLIIHRSRLADLPHICAPLIKSNVIIFADEPAYAALDGHYPQQLLSHASDTSFGTEFLDYKMAVKTVGSQDDAIRHITKYGSGHSESIISENEENCMKFIAGVDAACVYTNAPTSFTDGAQFGLGAEIGISTQKLHARGPMALEEITTYKWVIRGKGQIRP